MKQNKKIKIGIIGCGCIGSAVGEFVSGQMNKAMALSAVYDLKKSNAGALAKQAGKNTRVCSSLDEVIRKADLVIEAASVNVVREVLVKCIAQKKNAFIVSVGGLLGKESLFKKAADRGITIYIPSGAICGIDGISAFPANSIRKVTLTTIKSPTSLTDVDGTAGGSAEQEQVIFEGGVKEAIQKFPKNINVSALLFLASHYKDIRVCIKADPKIKRNVHKIDVDSEYGAIHLTIENVPSPDNPRTSFLTILSVENLLRKIVSCVKIGS